jgi:hypothetical protein
MLHVACRCHNLGACQVHVVVAVNAQPHPCHNMLLRDKLDAPPCNMFKQYTTHRLVQARYMQSSPYMLSSSSL